MTGFIILCCNTEQNANLSLENIQAYGSTADFSDEINLVPSKCFQFCQTVGLISGVQAVPERTWLYSFNAKFICQKEVS